MTLLDRFRTATPQKHPDANIRLAYVTALPISDRDVILSMAREDEDPRVRRAAVAKLMDAASLGAIVSADRDESVRAQASDMLRDLALEAFEGSGEAEALDAVEALTDARSLALVAKTVTREAVAVRALSSVTDPRAWGSIARHSPVEAARRSALALLSERHDQAEILAVAMNGEFKDTATGAVDLMNDRSELEQVAARSKNKSAVKRARALMREADLEQERLREAAAVVLREPEGVTVDPVGEIRPEVAWQAAEPDVAAVEKIPAAEAHDPAEHVQHGEAVGASLSSDAEGDASQRDERERQARDAESRRVARLTELADHAERAAADQDLAGGRRQLSLARREWSDLAGRGPIDDALMARFVDAESRLSARDRETRDADIRAKQEALSHLQHLLGRIETLTTKPDLSLKAAERAARDLRSAMAAVPPLPSKHDSEDVTRRLKAAHVALTPKLQELREADDWQRWANAGIQEELCTKMEALQSVEDPETVARTVKELQEQWRKSADVPRAQADLLWRRFKAAHDAVWPRCEAHFAAEAKGRAENLTKRVALCERAEALSDSTDWIRTAEEIKKCQAEWKTIGPVPRGREKAVWERFRTACDRFFTRRHDDLAQRKTLWTENLAKKTALCEKVEALAESSDWEAAAAEIKRLQAEWKTIGAVKKSRSDAIWQRFRAGCDRFFIRYGQRHDLARAERVAAREAICVELEAFVPDVVKPAAASPPDPIASAIGEASETETAGELSPEAAPADEAPVGALAPPADLLTQVRALSSRWQQELAARGVDLDRARVLDARFAAAHARVLARFPAVFAGTDLDPEANRKKMESLVKRVEDLARSLAGPAADPVEASLSPATRLAAMLKEALASNTIGGKVQDNSRLNAAVEEVRLAQANWSRLGPVPDPIRRSLADRLQRASRAIFDRQTRAASEAGQSGGATRAVTPGRTGRSGGR